MPLSRERVIAAAVSLADESGIDGLSMRKLAQALGVEAMSLYNHVAGKDDLLVGVVESVAGEIDLAPGGDWKAAMRTRAISAHEVLKRHPWAAGLWMTTRGFGGARMRFADAVLRGFREGGFSEALTYHGFHVLQSHIMGYSLYATGLSFEEGELEELAATFLREFEEGDYPDLAAHVRQHIEPSDEHAGAFEFGLDLILDGLERLRDGA